MKPERRAAAATHGLEVQKEEGMTFGGVYSFLVIANGGKESRKKWPPLVPFRPQMFAWLLFVI